MDRRLGNPFILLATPPATLVTHSCWCIMSSVLTGVKEDEYKRCGVDDGVECMAVGVR